MEGDPREFSLPAMPQFVSRGSRSGTLDVATPERRHRISFAGGVITGHGADDWSLTAQLRDQGYAPPKSVTHLLGYHFLQVEATTSASQPDSSTLRRPGGLCFMRRPRKRWVGRTINLWRTVVAKVIV